MFFPWYVNSDFQRNNLSLKEKKTPNNRFDGGIKWLVYFQAPSAALIFHQDRIKNILEFFSISSFFKFADDCWYIGHIL